MFTFDFKKFFIYSSQFWLLVLFTVNCLSLFFINSSLSHNTQAYDYAFAATAINVVLGYTITIYVLWFYKKIDPERSGPFHQWIFFSDNPWCNLVISLIILTWTIGNIVLLSNLAGVGYLLMLFFIVSIIYWLTIGAMMLYSYCNPETEIIRV